MNQMYSAMLAAADAKKKYKTEAELSGTYAPKPKKPLEVDFNDYLPAGYYTFPGSDATDYLQAAVNEAVGADKPGIVVMGAGDHYFPRTVNNTGSGNALDIRGAGCGDNSGFNWKTRLWTDQNNVILNTTEQGTKLSGLFFENTRATVDLTAGAAVTGTTISGSFMQQISLKGFFTCIDFSAGGEWTLKDSYIRNPKKYGLHIRNTVQPDSGDQTIDNVMFNNYSGGERTDATAIFWQSGGGLKLSNCKVNGSTKWAKGLDMSLAATTTDFAWANNSFENITGPAVHMHQDGASTATFGNMTFVGGNIARYSTDATSNDIRIDPANGVRPFTGPIIAGVDFHTTTAGMTSIYVSNIKNMPKPIGNWTGGYKRKIEQGAGCVNVALEPVGHSVWIPAKSFDGVEFGTPAVSSVNRRTVYLLDPASQEHITASPEPLLPWGSLGVDVYWTNPGAATGDVVFRATIDGTPIGGTLAAAGTASGPDTTSTAPAQGVLKRTALAGPDSSYSLAIPANSVLGIQIIRLAAAAADTLTGDAAVVGIMIYKTD